MFRAQEISTSQDRPHFRFDEIRYLLREMVGPAHPNPDPFHAGAEPPWAPGPAPWGLLPHPAQARSLVTGSCPGDARMLRWRIPSCSWWRGGSAASPTSPSPACCSGTGSRATWGARAEERRDGPAARPRVSGRGGLCVGPRVTRLVLACQGHFTRPEGPRLLPRLHQPPG